MKPLGRRLLSPTSWLTPGGRARRRYNCARQDEWDERAETAVELLVAHRDRWKPPSGTVTIGDLGAGNERLRPLLEKSLDCGVEYRPFDLHPQLPSTRHLDVTREMPDDSFDVVFCLGLLEYLPSIQDLASRLAKIARFALVSYVTSDSRVAAPYEDRLLHGWTTHLTAGEVESAFEDAGWHRAGNASAEGEITALWLWENAASSAGDRAPCQNADR